MKYKNVKLVAIPPMPLQEIVNRIFIENDRKEEILKRYENYKIDLSGLMNNQI